MSELAFMSIHRVCAKKRGIPTSHVVVVVAHSSSPSLVVVELEKISHRIWIVP